MYRQEYDSEDIRNKSYAVTEYISSCYANPHAYALDLGCGTCRKIIPLATKIRHYYAVDYNQSMLQAAQENLKASQAKNITLLLANNFFLPFQDASFDLISGFLTCYSLPEVLRLLKKKGTFILETLSPNDKKEMKKAFGQDELGWRGLMLNNEYENYKSGLECILRKLFDRVEVKTYTFQTTITREKLEILLEMTPTIRNFSKIRDANVLDSLCDHGNIHFTEERFLIQAIK